MTVDITPFDLLRWYLDAGADEAIGEAAIDRFKAVSEVKREAPPPPPPAAKTAAPVSATAAHLADGCRTLADLKAAMEAFDGLPLTRTATTTVFADGNPEARLMVIGEAPGQEEDRAGRPFVGRSGILLNKMLASIGLERERDVYITNVLAWRPLENRKPAPDEVAVCLPFLVRHIELIDPAMILLLGGAAASAVLARNEGINRLRGQWHDFASPGLSHPVPVIASFHPAYLLRTPEAKRAAWKDLLMVKTRLDAKTP